jgi:hypothetical protein
MDIRENDALDNSKPPFEVIEDGVVLFYSMTREECQEYIDNNS